MAVGRRRQSSLYRVSAAVVEPPALLLTTVLLIASTPYISSQGITAQFIYFTTHFDRLSLTVSSGLLYPPIKSLEPSMTWSLTIFQISKGNPVSGGIKYTE